MLGLPRINFWTVTDIGCFLTPFLLLFNFLLKYYIENTKIMKVKIKKFAPNEYIYVTSALTQKQDSPRPQVSSSCSLQSWFFPQLTTTIGKFCLFLNLVSREHRMSCFVSGFSHSTLFMNSTLLGPWRLSPCKYTTTYLSPLFLVDIWFNSFVTMTSSAVVNIFAHIFKWTWDVFLLAVCLGVVHRVVEYAHNSSSSKGCQIS